MYKVECILMTITQLVFIRIRGKKTNNASMFFFFFPSLLPPAVITLRSILEYEEIFGKLTDRALLHLHYDTLLISLQNKVILLTRKYEINIIISFFISLIIQTLSLALHYGN
jgi:hypothetical protein